MVAERVQVQEVGHVDVLQAELVSFAAEHVRRALRVVVDLYTMQIKTLTVAGNRYYHFLSTTLYRQIWRKTDGVNNYYVLFEIWNHLKI